MIVVESLINRPVILLQYFFKLIEIKLQEYAFLKLHFNFYI